jgi:hypothetical protein
VHGDLLMVSNWTNKIYLVIMELDIIWGGCLCLGSRCRVQLGLEVIKADALNSRECTCKHCHESCSERKAVIISQLIMSYKIAITFFSAMSSRAFSNSGKVSFWEPLVFDCKT